MPENDPHHTNRFDAIEYIEFVLFIFECVDRFS